MTNIRRNATRQIAALKASHTVAVAKTLDNGFQGQTAEAAFCWDKFEKTRTARASQKPDGTVVLSIHGNCWFELREPTA